MAANGEFVDTQQGVATSLKPHSNNSNSSGGAGGQHQEDASAMSVRSGATSVSIERQSYDLQNLPSTKLSISSSSGQYSSTQVDLTEIDGGLAMLLERSRQSLNSCKETVVFLKNRAKVEEDYGRSLQKVAQTTLKTMDRAGAGQSTQQTAWQRLVEVHETLASNRMKFSITLSEMSDYLSNYVKAKEGVRRRLKETEQRYQKAIEDSEASLEKARAKYELQSIEWEKLLVKTSKSDGGGNAAAGGGQGAVSKTKNVSNAVSGIFGKHKGTTQETLERMGQEAGVKTKMANESYKRILQQTNTMRRDFYDVQLPKILASVMGLVEEVDQFLKFSLGKYAYTYESAVLADAITLKPMDGAGGAGMVEMVGDIDSKADLDTYLQTAARTGGRVNRASIPYREYEMTAVARLYANPKHIFGVPLEAQLERDGQRVPVILAKCAEAVEAYGLQNEGIYRQSGQSSQVARLRNEFDLDASQVDLCATSSGVSDINNVASVLKMYLRELPGGLVPAAQRTTMLGYFSADDLDAEGCGGGSSSTHAQYSRDQDLALAQRISGLASAIRSLPRPHCDTLAFLFAHLDKVQAFQEFNMMNAENLGIVFGPTIFPTVNDPTNAALDIRRSAKLVKFILDNRKAIFEAL
ncbi:Rho GTPase-activating protein [Coemansia erecta]|uniref:Rho GTPase-activating protein n=1 Tax=Coemansia erecta TaxID=147472 RepID=A0A9W8CVA8_9FUNG|nr:Rho GTPase-activating protein [Coemansia erecta]